MKRLIRKIWISYMRGFRKLYGPVIEAGINPFI